MTGEGEDEYWPITAVRIAGDGTRPQGVVLQVRGETWVLDDRCAEVRPGLWEAYGPPGVIFREGEAGWWATFAPDGASVQLVTEDSPLCPGALQFRQPAPGVLG